MFSTYSPVPLKSGQTEFTRIWCGPYSAAKPFVAFATAPLEELYQTSPGRGLIAPILATLIMAPPFF